MASPMTVTIYHNPKCSTSRNALQLLRERGVEPVVVEYLKMPPTRAELGKLAKSAGARALLRTKEPLAKELGLDDPKVSDAQVLDAIAANPILLNRPVVAGPKGTVAARPIEKALEVL